MNKESSKKQGDKVAANNNTAVIEAFAGTSAFGELKELRDFDPYIHSVVEAVETLTKPQQKPAIIHFFTSKLARSGLHLKTAFEGGKASGWLVDEEGILNARGRALEKAIKLVKPLSDKLATN